LFLWAPPPPYCSQHGPTSLLSTRALQSSKFRSFFSFPSPASRKFTVGRHQPTSNQQVSSAFCFLSPDLHSHPTSLVQSNHNTFSLRYHQLVRNSFLSRPCHLRNFATVLAKLPRLVRFPHPSNPVHTHPPSLQSRSWALFPLYYPKPSQLNKLRRSLSPQQLEYTKLGFRSTPSHI
jgi:hypothetical protein